MGKQRGAAAAESALASALPASLKAEVPEAATGKDAGCPTKLVGSLAAGTDEVSPTLLVGLPCEALLLGCCEQSDPGATRGAQASSWPQPACAQAELPSLVSFELPSLFSFALSQHVCRAATAGEVFCSSFSGPPFWTWDLVRRPKASQVPRLQSSGPAPRLSSLGRRHLSGTPRSLGRDDLARSGGCLPRVRTSLGRRL